MAAAVPPVLLVWVAGTAVDLWSGLALDAAAGGNALPPSGSWKNGAAPRLPAAASQSACVALGVERSSSSSTRSRHRDRRGLAIRRFEERRGRERTDNLGEVGERHDVLPYKWWR